jgi:hypothetical protein
MEFRAWRSRRVDRRDRRQNSWLGTAINGVAKWLLQGSVRRDCVERLLILGRGQLEQVPRVYVKHYNGGRPHRALDLKPPDSRICSPIATVATPHTLQVNRRDLLGGLIHEYELAAA